MAARLVLILIIITLKYTMSYLRFDKTLLTNLEEALPKEVLRTNRSGAYSFSSILDSNTRKYHGLLVVPVPEIDDENHVLLASLDETVIQHGAEFNLGVKKYAGGVYAPNGHKYALDFEWDKIPTTIYRVGGVILKKEKVFQHFENRVLIRYTLLKAFSQTTIRLKPFLAFRNVKELTHENSVARRDYKLVDNGITIRLYDNYPELFMQTDKPTDFIQQPNWYHNMEYQREQELGYEFSEDQFVPGYFEFQIKQGESIVFSAGLNEVDTTTLAKTFDEEVEVHKPRSSFRRCLVNAAHQFHNGNDKEDYIMAGYPWFRCRARDTFVALPGLTLAIDEKESFEKVMDTAIKSINKFLAGEKVTGKLEEIEDPDVLLWAVWSIQQYQCFVSREEMLQRYGGIVDAIIDFILKGKHPKLEYETATALIRVEGTEKPVTWMNSVVNGYPVVPRSGYVVEINALWYNALVFASQINSAWGNQEKADRLNSVAIVCGKSFVDTFLNQHGYLLDYVDGDFVSWDVRPNMLIATALENTPLSKQQCKGIVDICTRELLTKKGIRSLTPKSGAYNPIYAGGQVQRDAAYHQGTVWPWLLGFYIETRLKVWKQSGLSFIDRCLVGLEEEMSYHCIGTLPELFDGNPPFHGRGASSFAMNVAEILRVRKLLSKYYNY